MSNTSSGHPPHPYDHEYHLQIDGPLFRRQRELLCRLMLAAGDGVVATVEPGEFELLDGLVNLTDEIADQAHDKWNIDCLLDDGGE